MSQQLPYEANRLTEAFSHASRTHQSLQAAWSCSGRTERIIIDDLSLQQESIINRIYQLIEAVKENNTR
jgi:hypothetical protein